MNYSELVAAIRRQKSFLCVGLDTDPSRLPKSVLDAPDPVLRFNEAIISATKDFCVSYKVNTAFYEAQGELGWQRLRQTCELIPKTHFCILDAKRGDIGNTSTQYAKAFDDMGDAVTVAPYRGEDSVVPFLEHSNLWVILLALVKLAYL
ncbi:MAG: orotidine-5'-phosphate decarboxylase [Bacteroidota bacterium]